MSDVALSLVIEDLADAEAALRERVASLEADVAVYRELALVAFDIVYDLTRRNRALVIRRARMGEDILNELWAAQDAAVQQSLANDEGVG
jgi:hypothetical protein